MFVPNSQTVFEPAAMTPANDVRRLSKVLAAVAAPALAHSNVESADFFNSGPITTNNTVGWLSNVLQQTSFSLTLENGTANFRTLDYALGTRQFYGVKLGTNAAGQSFRLAAQTSNADLLKTFPSLAVWAQAQATGNDKWFGRLSVSADSVSSSGNFNVSGKFLLFKFKNNAEDYYGWIQVDGHTAGTRNSKNLYVTVKGYAWQKGSLGVIQAGATAVPEPSALATGGIAALTGGAVALRRWRRARKQSMTTA